MDRLLRPFGPFAARLAALAAVAAFAGCTMCPDPYDYSGPVPNGSAPQNDFRARSGGILPLGAAACPWPPLVGKSSAAVDEIVRAGVAGGLRQATFQEPTPADPPFDSAGVDDPAGPMETMSVLVVPEDVDDGMPESPVLVVAEPAEHHSPEPADAGDAVAAVPVTTVAVPLAETPGWRSRR
jgi:hypothetical protein